MELQLAVERISTFLSWLPWIIAGITILPLVLLATVRLFKN